MISEYLKEFFIFKRDAFCGALKCSVPELSKNNQYSAINWPFRTGLKNIQISHSKACVSGFSEFENSFKVRSSALVPNGRVCGKGKVCFCNKDLKNVVI